MEGGKIPEERERLGELYFELAKYYFNIEKNFKVYFVKLCLEHIGYS
jgi:hypothetical protein